MQNVELKIKTEVYSRIVGYFRPVDQWNGAKKEEFYERGVASKDFIDKFGKENKAENK